MNISKRFGVGAPLVHDFRASESDAVNPDLVIGFELETENIANYRNMHRGEGVVEYNYTAKTDGSLRGNALEFVSVPMKTATALAATRLFLENSNFSDANYTDRCSIHVHVNMTDMTSEQVASICLAYTVVEEILFSYVGHERDNNIYCIPWSHCRNHYNLIMDFLYGGRMVKAWEKYTALNLLPLLSQGTLEFRHMYGTANYEAIKTWVNMIGGLCKYGSEVSLKEMIEVIRNMNTVSNYREFFNNVFKGSLTYNEEYRSKLEEGVIIAKYMLLTYKEKDNVTEEKKEAEIEFSREAPMPVEGAATTVAWHPIGTPAWIEDVGRRRLEDTEVTIMRAQNNILREQRINAIIQNQQVRNTPPPAPRRRPGHTTRVEE